MGPPPPPTAFQSKPTRVIGEASSPALAALEERIARPVAADPSRPDPAWARRELQARATGMPPAAAPSETTRRLMAKRDAISQAWRDLASQVERMQIPGYRTVGDYAAADSEAQTRIQDLVREARVVEDLEHAEGVVEVTLALRADPLATWLPPSGDLRAVESRPAGPTQEDLYTRERLQQEALQMAEQDARRKLLEMIKAAPAGPGQTIGQAMQSDPYLAGQMQGLAQAAPVVERRFPDPSRAEVVLDFDMARAQRAAAGY